MRVMLFEASLADSFSYARRMLSELAAAGHMAADEFGDDVVALVDGPALGAFTQEHPAALGRAVAMVHQPEAMTGADALASLRGMVVTGAPAATALAAAHPIPLSRIHVVAPGAEAHPRATGSGSATCHILSVGALKPRKGHEVLLTALARLGDLDWRLTIAGERRDAAFATALDDQARTLGIADRLTIVPRADEALWDGADVFCLASHWESYPAAAAEALSRGLPLAITDAGDAAGIVPTDAAAILPPGDAVNLGKSLRRLIYDRATRAAMADAAWTAGQKLPTWAAQANLLAAVLERGDAQI